MPALTLCINAGSSSVKYALFDEAADCITTHSERFERASDSDAQRAQARQTIKSFLELIATRGIDPEAIRTCAHRFVFGGRIFPHAAVVDAPAKKQLQSLCELAPLHMPAALQFVDATQDALPKAVTTGHFDTAFHQTIPKINRAYALPNHYYAEGVCRFGFHGLSYAYISQQLTTLSTQAAGRWVIAHLGSGASLCGIKNGQSQICTMGFSPLEGLPMASRSGQIDPGVIIHLLRNKQLSVDDVEALLYQQSGLLGLSGVSGDWQTIKQHPSDGAKFAKDYFIEHIVQHIGKVVAHLQGLDGIVFTGGIGENDSECVAAVIQRLQWLGFQPDRLPAIDRNGESAMRVSPANAAIEAWVIATNEAAVMAQEARQLNATAQASTDKEGSTND